MARLEQVEPLARATGDSIELTVPDDERITAIRRIVMTGISPKFVAKLVDAINDAHEFAVEMEVMKNRQDDRTARVRELAERIFFERMTDGKVYGEHMQQNVITDVHVFFDVLDEQDPTPASLSLIASLEDMIAVLEARLSRYEGEEDVNNDDDSTGRA